MEQKIAIEFWGDIICPMCPIGYVNLKEGIRRFSNKDNVQLTYHSFRLRPGIAPHSVDTYLKRNHGPDTDVASILKMVEQWGADAGLEYKMANTQAGDTMDAHRLVHFAGTKGLQMETVEHLQRAHFAEEENLFDHDTLLRLAVEIGLNRDEVDSMLAGDTFKKDVETDQQALYQLGVSGVPFFLVDGQFTLNGVQTPEEFEKALNRAWKSKQTEVDATDNIKN